jgi:hypothetical protein
MSSEHFPLNTRFKPSPALVTWFSVNFLLLILFVLCIAYVPVALFAGIPLETHIAILGGIAAVIIIFIIWTRLYYESMWYELREDEMSWKRGVWFRKTGIVPYNRITNLDIRQGPVMRALGISTLSIQTAGYSGQAVPEIRIEAIVHAEELRELIRTMVRGHIGAGGDGTGTGIQTPASLPRTADLQILDELKKIRALLEERKGL